MQKNCYGQPACPRGRGSLDQILRVMRLTACLLIAAFMHSYATGVAQNVSLSGKSITLKQVFTAVEKQTGFFVLYSLPALKNARPVTITAENVPLEQFLTEVFNAQPSLKFNIRGKNIFISEKTISIQTDPAGQSAYYTLGPPVFGIVIDSAGRPLAGASIRIKGKKISAISDENGRYSLAADKGEILVVSFVGYREREIAVPGDGQLLNIQLMPVVSRLQEVEIIVNTGYQSLSKGRSTGSFSKPDMQVIANRTSTMNVLQRLDGLIPGLTVNNAPNRVPVSATDPGKNDPFIIRGITSINASRSPLFVVDGIAVEDVAFINPQDVADITVLKDATAASIWGARASNGVVVITTKKGSNQRAPQIRYSSFLNLRGKPDLDYMPVLNGRQFIEAARETFDPVTYPYNTVAAYESIYSKGLAPHDEILYNQAGLTQEQVNAKLDSLGAIDNRGQIRDLWYRNAFLMNHTLSVDGGGERYAYYGSLSFTDDHSNKPGEKNNTYKVNLRQDFKLNRNISLYLVTDLNNTQASGKRTIDVSNKFYPYQLFRDEAGKALSMPYMKYLSEPVRADYEQRSRISLNYNPLEEFNYGNTNVNNVLSRVNSGITIKLFGGLKFEGVYGYTAGSLKTKVYDDALSYKVRSEVAQFTVAPTAADIPIYYLPATGGTYGVSNTSQRNWSVRNQLSFDRSWNGNVHQLSLLAGQEAQEQLSVTENTTVRGYNEALQTYANIDYARLANGIFSPVMSNSFGMSVLNNDAFRSMEVRSRFTSYFANLGYTFQNRYSVNASWRIDQSSLFGKDKSAQNRPVVSGGVKWQISQEDFMHPVKWVDQLGLRATYGITGNSLPVGSGGSYDILYAAVSTFYAGGTGMGISTPGNGALSWESTSTLNLGLDFGLFRNRLTGTLDFYKKRTKDLLGTLLLNPFSGYTNVTGNSGELENTGFEFSVSHINIQTPSFSWQTTLLGAYNKNEVTKMFREYPLTQVGQKLGANFMEGYPGFAIFAFQYEGLDHDGRPQIRRADKSLTTEWNGAKLDDVIFAGTYQPVWSGGFSNAFRYKNFGLTANISYNLGHVMRRDVNILYTGRFSHEAGDFNSGNVHADFDRRWRQPGDEKFTDIPPYIADFATSFLTRNTSYYIQGNTNIVSASYIKMRDITLSYSLPQALLQRLKCRELSFRIQLSNVMLWKANKFGIDPEFQNTLSGARTLPVDQRSFSFGIQAGF